MAGAFRGTFLLTLLAITQVAVSHGAEVSLAEPAIVGSMTGIPAAKLRQWSAEVDRLVRAGLEAAGEQPNPRASDEVFLRRVYLDLAGRIPTLSETRSFLESRHQNKREQLVDSLLDSPAYTSHQFNYWADLLRAKSRLQGGNPGQPYLEFIRESLRENVPFDQFVRRMISSSGAALEKGNGATGYYLRDFNMPEDNMANTVRIFLGTRLECAQCHDHPFDKWKQREFFEMVAFTGGMRMRTMPTDGHRPNELRRELQRANVNPEVRQVALRILRPMSFGVAGGGTGLARLPDTYQYDDGAPNEIVTAKTMFGHTSLVEPETPQRGQAVRPRRSKKKKESLALEIPGAQDVGSRDAFAIWLTSPDNPRFTQVIANRMWKKLFGVGLIEPVDDMTDATVASNPALMEYLTTMMRDLKYDLKQYQRVLCYCDAYQREAVAIEVDDPYAFHFPGPLVRRLSAEQLWDSFVTLAVPNVDTKEGPRGKGVRAMMMPDDLSYEQLKDMSAEDIVKLAEQRVESRNDPQRRQQIRREITASMGDGHLSRADMQEARQQLEAIRAELKDARKKKDVQAAKSAQGKLRELTQKVRGVGGRAAPDLARASELPSPAPEGHFLREFGQSDREQIENANYEPAVTQVLSLMNGTIETRVVRNPKTVLMQSIEEAKKPSEKVDVVFLSLLNRYPTREEKALWLKEGQRYGASAAIDLIWTLANTNEFMFVH